MKNPFAATHVITNGRRAVMGSALALTIATGAISGPVLAQDGTGAATPTPPSACKVVPAQATSASSSATPVSATPEASPAMGTPAAHATPVVAEEDATTADTALTQDLEASATAIAGCLTDGNLDTLSQLTGDLYRGQLIGFSEKLSSADFMALAASLPQAPYQIISVENATFTADKTATADVTYEMAHQVRKSTWDFSLQNVDGTTAWVLESETPLAPDVPDGTSTVNLTIKDGAFELKENDVAGPSVQITAKNTGKVEHEVLVLRFEGDATTKTLLQSPGPALPKNVVFVGQVTVPAGDSGSLLLSGLQPGTYTIVDMLPNADGLPNVVGGMQVEFKIK